MYEYSMCVCHVLSLSLSMYISQRNCREQQKGGVREKEEREGEIQRERERERGCDGRLATPARSICELWCARRLQLLARNMNCWEHSYMLCSM